MKSRDDLRRELEEIARDMQKAGIGVAPLVCAVRRTGENGETRPPGLYYDAGGPVVVCDDERPTAEEFRQFWPASEQLPLLIGGEADVNAL